MNVFENINELDLKKLFICLEAKKINFKKGATIISNAGNIDLLGIITHGKANIIRIDYNGNRTIIDTLNANEVFESKIFNLSNNELTIVALEDTEIIIIEYDKVINRCKKNCPYHNQFIDNILNVLMNKLNFSYQRIEMLTKKTTRDKLLEYFRYLSYEKGTKTFKMPMNFSSLAEYLSVDRSAMMREIKNLKEDGFLEIKDKKIKINY